MSDYYNLATHALSIHDQLPTCTLNYNYTARYFAIPFLVLHVNFNLLLHNKLHLMTVLEVFVYIQANMVYIQANMVYIQANAFICVRSSGRKNLPTEKSYSHWLFLLINTKQNSC